MQHVQVFVEAGVLTNIISSESAMQFLKSILGGIMYMSIPIIGLALVYSGLMFVLARGNSDKIGIAIRNFTYIIIGIALILGSYMIAGIVYNTIIKGILGWA